jgi:hypothetical protein
MHAPCSHACLDLEHELINLSSLTLITLACARYGHESMLHALSYFDNIFDLISMMTNQKKYLAIARRIRARDENGAETDGTKCCHICFHIFMRKQKRIWKYRKQIWKQILSEINMKRIRYGRGRKADDCRNQETTWIMKKNSRKSGKLKNLCPKPVTITRCNGGVGYGFFFTVQYDKITYWAY